jgi:error-prone DNA polymerase
MSLNYAELCATSNFSFLQGASHPEELVWRSKELDLYAIGITDTMTLGGVVRAYHAGKSLSQRVLVGCKLLIEHGSTVLNLYVHPFSKKGYENLSELLTASNFNKQKSISFNNLLAAKEGLIISIEPSLFQQKSLLEIYADNFSKENFLSLLLFQSNFPGDATLFEEAGEISKESNIPLLASNRPLYHTPKRRALHDVLTCVREHTCIFTAGTLLEPNASRYLKSASEIGTLFSKFPESLERSRELSEVASNFSLTELKYFYPAFSSDENTQLEKLVYDGATKRYGVNIPEKVQALLKEELALIKELKYERYFLTCHEIITFTESKGILCQGRGAAANSAVCFCLGITAVNPASIDLLFGRFISRERGEPPDIDIDFEHERREEVIQFIYERYGRKRAALTGSVVTYRHRSALRDIGKALGLPLPLIDKLAKNIHRWTGYEIEPEILQELGLDVHSGLLKNLLELTEELVGFPRHLSQHVGGFIISSEEISNLCPVLPTVMEGRSIIEWDKDDIETLQMLKIDILALGMLTCIRKALNYINELGIYETPLQLHTIPLEDQAVYEMLCQGDSIGVFQVESRAQISMLTRLKPQCFYDLVIQVAIVRPGPIQGNMVHPFLKRRANLESFTFPDDRVAGILGKTLGVPLFQEQAMRLAITLANFSPGEAESLRRAMAAWKRNEGVIARFKERVVLGMMKNGYTEDFANTCMNQIIGFAEYGFPESHAASFALLVYASAWIKAHYPAVFTAALLNSQPLGFYQPAQLIACAKVHGVKVKPVDFFSSEWDSSVEEEADKSFSLQLGFRLINGLPESHVRHLIEARAYFKLTPTLNITEIWEALYRYTLMHKLPGKSRVNIRSMMLLARSDAFFKLNSSSREIEWEIKKIQDPPLLLPFKKGDLLSPTYLPPLSLQEEVFREYQATGFALKGHPVGLKIDLLNKLPYRKVEIINELSTRKNVRDGSQVNIAGLVVMRQRPGTAKGVVFLTIEDESGLANLIIKPKIFQTYRGVILSSMSVLVGGKLQLGSKEVYVVVHTMESLDPEFDTL